MPNVTINVPAGYVGASIYGTDGVSYPVASSQVVMPQAAVPKDLWAAGFSFGAGGTGGTGVTGTTGNAGNSGATGAAGAAAAEFFQAWAAVAAGWSSATCRCAIRAAAGGCES